MSPKRCWTGAPKPPKTLESMPPPYIADQSQIGTSKGLFFIVATATTEKYLREAKERKKKKTYYFARFEDEIRRSRYRQIKAVPHKLSFY